MDAVLVSNGVEVGREDCDCTGEVTEHGTLAGTYSQVLEPVSCSGGGGGGDDCLVAPTGDSTSVAPLCP